MSNSYVDRGAIDRLVELGKELHGPVVEVEGIPFWRDTKRPVLEPHNFDDVAIRVSTIKSFCDYVNSVRSQVRAVIVESIGIAVALGQIQTTGVQAPKRPLLATLMSASGPDEEIDGWHSLADFIPLVRTMFLEGEARDDFLDFCSGIQAESVAKLQDNESVQTVVVKKGIESISRTPVKNPVALLPQSPFPDEVDTLAYFYNVEFRNVGDGKLPEARLVPFNHNETDREMRGAIQSHIDNWLNYYHEGEEAKRVKDPIIVLV